MTPPQKGRIIDQAMQMFVSQGIKSVRMDDIAQQLGVSKRTLYEMFGDKEGLLYLAMERYSERNRQRWNELTADAHDVLEAMFMVLGEVMDNAEVSFQTAELGKVDAGGGGTIAYIPAKYGMDVIDSGVAVLSMHAPWEVTSKADIFEAYRGYRAFLEA